MAEEPKQGEKKPIERVIRVFISSTFRDMQMEREILIKRVFPQLRKLCEERAVSWTEVDLRWGITSEESAEGKVLPICLEEIQRCRPYFIGLLGERYGWVSQNVPNELLEREPWLMDQLREGKSVTELEILHGVLRDPLMAEHAYFYLRGPKWLDYLPSTANRADYVSENASAAEKLRRLKDQIRASGLPVRENYPTPEALGELVRSDLTAVLNRLFPQGSQPDPLAQEAMEQEAYARSRETLYISRPEYFARLDTHAAEVGNQPLVITGQSGAGKSALLANWTSGYRRTHPEVLVLEHYIGASPAGADWAHMVRRIMAEFKQRLGLEECIPEQPEALRSEFPNWLHRAAGKGRIILIIDAINQLEDRQGALDLVWLPSVLPANMRLILSTLPGRSLEEMRKRGWPSLNVAPLDAEERIALVRDYLALYAKSLSRDRVQRIADAPQSANPLYLRVLLDELRVFGEHARLDERIDHCLDARSPRELYRKVIARWEEDFGDGTAMVADTLSLLWAARRGLSESELLDLLGNKCEPLPRSAWSPLFLGMADALINRNGLLTFAHDFLRTAATDAFVPSESLREQAHTRLADYFDSRELGKRKAEEFPWQLLRAKRWARLARVLSNLPFLETINYYDAAHYWQELEGNSGFRANVTYRLVLQDCERYAEHVDIVGFLLGSRGHAIEAAELLKHKADRCRKAGDRQGLARALGNLAATLSCTSRPDEAIAACRELEQICREDQDPQGRVRALSTMGMILSQQQRYVLAIQCLEEAIEIARTQRIGVLLANALVNLGAVFFSMAELWATPGAAKEMAADPSMQELLGSPDSRSLAANLLDQALMLYREVETLATQAGDMIALYKICLNQADVLLKQGQVIAAEAKAKRADSICREMGSKLGLARALDREAQSMQAQGNHHGALAVLLEQERLLRGPGGLPARMLQACLANQGMVLEATGELDAAIAKFREQAQICRGEGIRVPPAREWQPID
jgi:tetratricopeptide (TPR) repeat protein